jgi:uncharacterized protein YjgD (DUF1641 family)
MTTTTTINGLIKLAKDECARVAKLKDVTYSPAMKNAIESVLEMGITKSGNDPKVMDLAVTVREALN